MVKCWLFIVSQLVAMRIFKQSFIQQTRGHQRAFLEIDPMHDLKSHYELCGAASEDCSGWRWLGVRSVTNSWHAWHRLTSRHKTRSRHLVTSWHVSRGSWHPAVAVGGTGPAAWPPAPPDHGFRLQQTLHFHFHQRGEVVVVGYSWRGPQPFMQM